MGYYAPGGGGGGASFPLTNAAAATSTVEYQTKVIGDAQNRFQITADGTESWGSGSAAPNTSIANNGGMLELQPGGGAGGDVQLRNNATGAMICNGNLNYPIALGQNGVSAWSVINWFSSGGGGLDVYPQTGAHATADTAGFMWLRTCPGAPTGVPANISQIPGCVPMVYDTTNHKLWIYDTAWKGVVVA